MACPQLQLVQDPSVQHICQQGKVTWGPKGQANPTELSFLFSSAPFKKLCAQCSGGKSMHRNNQESFHLPPAAEHHLGQLPS